MLQEQLVLTGRLERPSPRYEGGVLPDELGQRICHSALPETSAANMDGSTGQRIALCKGDHPVGRFGFEKARGRYEAGLAGRLDPLCLSRQREGPLPVTLR